MKIRNPRPDIQQYNKIDMLSTLLKIQVKILSKLFKLLFSKKKKTKKTITCFFYLKKIFMILFCLLQIKFCLQVCQLTTTCFLIQLSFLVAKNFSDCSIAILGVIDNFIQKTKNWSKNRKKLKKENPLKMLGFYRSNKTIIEMHQVLVHQEDSSKKKYHTGKNALKMQ